MVRRKPIILSQRKFDNLFPEGYFTSRNEVVWERCRELIEDDAIFCTTITYILNSEWRWRSMQSKDHYA